ncbi:MAG: CAAX prenyl protease-related protein [Planctomycetota bacterium]
MSGTAADEGIAVQDIQADSGLRSPWVVFLLPFALFMVFTQFEPKPPELNFDWAESGAVGEDGLSEAERLREQDPAYQSYVRNYPLVYTTKVAVVTLAVLLVSPGYRTVPWRLTWLGPVVGLVGIVVWVALCELNLEDKLLRPLGIALFSEAGQRSAFDPLHALRGNPVWAYGFLAIRFFGLAVLVPVMEEAFLRGFLMRYVVDERWWAVPFGTATRGAIIAGTAFPMLMHPGELLAAFVWFSMVTWLMLRTKSLGDCVVAHGVTNLLLGFYVLQTGSWELW